MEKTKTFSFTTVYVILFGVLLLLTNILLGTILMKQSVDSLTVLVRKNMLSIVGTAAELVDGDQLGALTEEDKDGPVFNEIKDQLSAFQNNIDIEYIYAVRKIGPDDFIFTVDADPNDPADFGEEVLVTDALRSAGDGIPMVDNEPAQDEWGNFYSAYYPVKDSEGNISGIIGVDFDSQWYEKEVRTQTTAIGLITTISAIVGFAIMLVISRRMREKFDSLSRELSTLSDDIDQLEQEITAAWKKDSVPEEETDAKEDEIEQLGHKVRNMHETMRNTLDYMKEKATTDALTGINNRTAYLDKLEELESEIDQKTASFTFIVFDVNNLKQINDQYGHDCGDRVIAGTAEVLCSIFGKENIYRIGGDEFLAILKGMREEEIKAKMDQLEPAVAAYNQKHASENGVLNVAAGLSSFCPETDHLCRDVFIRADSEMYSRKKAYHDQLELAKA